MKIEQQMVKELENAGYKFVRHGKHNIYRNSELNHTITISVTTRDTNCVRIIRGLIRRGSRQARKT